MGKTIRQPRASIACSRNRDPEYLTLAKTTEGMAAVGFFDALLCAAKDQGNGGVFRRWDDQLLSDLTGTPRELCTNFCRTLRELSWLVERRGSLVIRSYEKWNPSEGRGGKRVGAGRPKSKNQNEIKTKSKRNQIDSSPSPFPSPIESDALSREESKPTAFENAPQFERDFWDEYPNHTNKHHRQEAERVWCSLTVADRLKAAVAVKQYAVAMAGKAEVLRPDRWLEGRVFDTFQAEKQQGADYDIVNGVRQ